MVCLKPVATENGGLRMTGGRVAFLKAYRSPICRLNHSRVLINWKFLPPVERPFVQVDEQSGALIRTAAKKLQGVNACHG